MEPALLRRNLNRRKFPMVMVNESEQPYKLVANVLIGRLETGGKVIFSKGENNLGRTTLVIHEINT